MVRPRAARGAQTSSGSWSSALPPPLPRRTRLARLALVVVAVAVAVSLRAHAAHAITYLKWSSGSCASNANSPSPWASCWSTGTGAPSYTTVVDSAGRHESIGTDCGDSSGGQCYFNGLPDMTDNAQNYYEYMSVATGNKVTLLGDAMSTTTVFRLKGLILYGGATLTWKGGGDLIVFGGGSWSSGNSLSLSVNRNLVLWGSGLGLDNTGQLDVQLQFGGTSCSVGRLGTIRRFSTVRVSATSTAATDVLVTFADPPVASQAYQVQWYFDSGGVTTTTRKVLALNPSLLADQDGGQWFRFGDENDGHSTGTWVWNNMATPIMTELRVYRYTTLSLSSQVPITVGNLNRDLWVRGTFICGPGISTNVLSTWAFTATAVWQWNGCTVNVPAGALTTFPGVLLGPDAGVSSSVSVTGNSEQVSSANAAGDFVLAGALTFSSAKPVQINRLRMAGPAAQLIASAPVTLAGAATTLCGTVFATVAATSLTLGANGNAAPTVCAQGVTLGVNLLLTAARFAGSGAVIRLSGVTVGNAVAFDGYGLAGPLASVTTTLWTPRALPAGFAWAGTLTLVATPTGTLLDFGLDAAVATAATTTARLTVPDAVTLGGTLTVPALSTLSVQLPTGGTRVQSGLTLRGPGAITFVTGSGALLLDNSNVVLSADVQLTGATVTTSTPSNPSGTLTVTTATFRGACSLGTGIQTVVWAPDAADVITVANAATLTLPAALSVSAWRGTVALAGGTLLLQPGVTLAVSAASARIVSTFGGRVAGTSAATIHLGAFAVTAQPWSVQTDGTLALTFANGALAPGSHVTVGPDSVVLCGTGMTLSSGSTWDGSGVLSLHGCTLRSGFSLATSFAAILGPSTGGATTLAFGSGGSGGGVIALPRLTAWSGQLVVTGTAGGVLQLGSDVRVTGSSASLVSVSAVVVNGALNASAATGAVTLAGVVTNDTLQLIGPTAGGGAWTGYWACANVEARGAASTLVFANTAQLTGAITGSGSVQFTGTNVTLRRGTNVAVTGPVTVTSSAATVRLDGAAVAGLIPDAPTNTLALTNLVWSGTLAVDGAAVTLTHAAPAATGTPTTTLRGTATTPATVVFVDGALRGTVTCLTLTTPTPACRITGAVGTGVGPVLAGSSVTVGNTDLGLAVDGTWTLAPNAAWTLRGLVAPGTTITGGAAAVLSLALVRITGPVAINVPSISALAGTQQFVGSVSLPTLSVASNGVVQLDSGASLTLDVLTAAAGGGTWQLDGAGTGGSVLSVNAAMLTGLGLVTGAVNATLTSAALAAGAMLTWRSSGVLRGAVGGSGALQLQDGTVAAGAILNSAVLLGPGALQTVRIEAPRVLPVMTAVSGTLVLVGTGTVQFAGLSLLQPSPGGSVTGTVSVPSGQGATATGQIWMPLGGSGTSTLQLSAVAVHDGVLSVNGTGSTSGGVRTVDGTVTTTSTGVLQVGGGGVLLSGQVGGAGTLWLSDCQVNAGAHTVPLVLVGGSVASIGAAARVWQSLRLADGAALSLSGTTPSLSVTGTVTVPATARVQVSGSDGGRLQVTATVGSASSWAGTLQVANGGSVRLGTSSGSAVLALSGAVVAGAGSQVILTGATVQAGASFGVSAGVVGGETSSPRLTLTSSALAAAAIHPAYAVVVAPAGTTRADFALAPVLWSLQVSAGARLLLTSTSPVTTTGALALVAPCTLALDDTLVPGAAVRAPLNSTGLATLTLAAGSVTTQALVVSRIALGALGGVRLDVSGSGTSALNLTGGTRVDVPATASLAVRASPGASSPVAQLLTGGDQSSSGASTVTLGAASAAAAFQLDAAAALAFGDGVCLHAPALLTLPSGVTMSLPVASTCDPYDVYNSCAQGQCHSNGTATCTNDVNAYTCHCRPGYTGTHCQSDIDECASAPCQHGGTCTDRVNGYACACMAGWEGVQCQTDVDECHVAPYNTSCPADPPSSCVNSPGAWACVWIDGALHDGASQRDSTATQPLRLANTGPQTLDFVVVTTPAALPVADYFTVWASAAPDFANVSFTDPQSDGSPLFDRVRCTNVTEDPLTVATTVHRLRCALPEWYGVANRLFVVRKVSAGDSSTGSSSSMETNPSSSLSPPLFAALNEAVESGRPVADTSLDGIAVAFSNHTFEYPPVQLLAATTRTLDGVPRPPSTLDPRAYYAQFNPAPAALGGRATDPTDSLLFDDSGPHPLIFDGRNLGPRGNPRATRVTYGPASDVTRYPCTLVAGASSHTTVVCVTAAPRTEAAALRVHVRVGPYDATGTDYVSFPIKPELHTVRGCNVTDADAALGTTRDCPTRGNVTLFFTGRNLFAAPVLRIFVDGVPCRDVHANPDGLGFNGTCVLGEGTGRNRTVTADALGYVSAVPDHAQTLSFADPTTTALVGCVLPGTAARPHQPRNCSRDGGDVLTVVGRNFGARGASVLLGSDLLTASGGWVVHDPSAPHERLWVRVPPGSGVNRPVLVLQDAFADIPAATVFFDYVQCRPGQYQNGTRCVPCGPATYSAQDDALSCTACADGTYTPTLFGNTACTACPPGRYSVGNTGTDACEPCSAGRAQSAERQTTCAQCTPGRFSNTTEQTDCRNCERGTHQSREGQTACDRCAGNLNQPDMGQPACAKCFPGQYWNGVRCELCPTGAACSDSGIDPLGNYYVYWDADTHTIVADECQDGACTVCPPLNFTGPGVSTPVRNRGLLDFARGTVFSCCAGARVDAQQNPLCGKCADGYYQWGQACVQCDKANVGLIFLFVLVSWAYVTVFYKMAQVSRADMRILLNFLQYVLIFLQTQAGGIVAWLSLVNFNMFQSSGGGQCVAPLSPVANLATGLFLPLVGAGLLLLNGALHVALWHCLRHRGCCARHLPPLSSSAASAAVAAASSSSSPTSPTNANNKDTGTSTGTGTGTDAASSPRSSASASEAAMADAAAGKSPPAAVRRSHLRVVSNVAAANFLESARSANGVSATERSGSCGGYCVGQLADLRATVSWWPVVNTYRRALLAFACSSYPPVAQTVFAFFTCVDAAGDRWLQSFPAVSCTSDPEYRRVYPLFVVLMLGVVSAPLVLLARLGLLYRRGTLFHDADVRFVYGAVTEAYPARHWFWEVWVLTRRFVVAAVCVAAFPNPKDLPMKFTVLCVLSVVFYAVHYLKRPYTAVRDNLYESLSLVTLVLLTLFLIDAPRPLPAARAAGLSAMCFVVGAIFAGRIVWSRYETFVAEDTHLKALAAKRLAALSAAKARRDRAATRAAATAAAATAGAAAVSAATNAAGMAVPSTSAGAAAAAAADATNDGSAGGRTSAVAAAAAAAADLVATRHAPAVHERDTAAAPAAATAAANDAGAEDGLSPPPPPPLSGGDIESP